MAQPVKAVPLSQRSVPSPGPKLRVDVLAIAALNGQADQGKGLLRLAADWLILRAK